MISFECPLRSDEKQLLAGILRCEATELDERLQKYCLAASEEYARMFLGQKVYKRGSDIREYRLLLLIQHAFAGRIPDEQQVCDLFQTTANESRLLIRSVMSKFQYDLSAAIRRTLTETLRRIQREGEFGDGSLTVNNECLIDQLNRQLASIDGTLPQIQKKRGTVSTYFLKASSYAALRREFGLEDEGEQHG